MSVGLYSCSRLSRSSWKKRLLATWVSMSVVPATCVQLPIDRPVVARPIDRVQAFELRDLVGPVAHRLEERVARDAEEEAVVAGHVVVDAAGIQRADRLVRLSAAVVVVGRRRPVLDQVLIGRRHHLLVQVVERIDDPVRRNDVVRERVADEPVRIRRIGAHRQRIVNLILRRVRQPEQIGEVAVELRGARGHGARRLVLAGNEVVHVASSWRRRTACCGR